MIRARIEVIKRGGEIKEGGSKKGKKKKKNQPEKGREKR